MFKTVSVKIIDMSSILDFDAFAQEVRNLKFRALTLEKPQRRLSNKKCRDIVSQQLGFAHFGQYRACRIMYDSCVRNGLIEGDL